MLGGVGSPGLLCCDRRKQKHRAMRETTTEGEKEVSTLLVNLMLK